MPDPADDVPHRIHSCTDALRYRALTACATGPARPHVAHPGFQPVLQPQPTDDPAGGDRDAQAEYKIGQCDLPADQTEQQAECHLVHHRRGDQEGEGDAQRHAGRHKADEQRHGRAGAERRDDAERCGEHVADALALPCQQEAGALRREEAAHHAHDEHDQREQQQHLRRVVEKERHGFVQPGFRRHRQYGDQPLRERSELAIEYRPQNQAGHHEAQRLCFLGSVDALGVDMHRSFWRSATVPVPGSSEMVEYGARCHAMMLPLMCRVIGTPDSIHFATAIADRLPEPQCSTTGRPSAGRARGSKAGEREQQRAVYPLGHVFLRLAHVDQHDRAVMQCVMHFGWRQFMQMGFGFIIAPFQENRWFNRRMH